MKLTVDYKDKLLKTYNDFKCKVRYDKDYSLFFPMIGENFELKKTFLVVGRACNGWIDPWKVNDQRDDVVSKAISYSEKGENSQMEWLIKRWTREFIDCYNIRRSTFWRVIRNLILELSQCDESNWPRYLAWSNLMKISPHKNGNPNGKECEAQLENCKELLKQEIEELNPKYVLLVVGLNWGESFLGFITKDIKKPNNKIVERIANYKNSRILLTVRPEGKKDETFVNSIKTYF